jgi:hypothetical protein
VSRYSDQPCLFLSALVLCAPLFSQQLMPVGFVRGSLLSWTGSTVFGNLTVQRADGEVYDCSYDAHTLFQRDQWPIHVADLKHRRWQNWLMTTQH